MSEKFPYLLLSKFNPNSISSIAFLGLIGGWKWNTLRNNLGLSQVEYQVILRIRTRFCGQNIKRAKSKTMCRRHSSLILNYKEEGIASRRLPFEFFNIIQLWIK